MVRLGLMALPLLVLLALAFLHTLKVTYRGIIERRDRHSRNSSYIYFYRGKYELPLTVKVGKADDPKKRLLSQRTANPFGLHVYGVVRVRNGYKSEAIVHQRFARWRISSRNEWFWMPPMWLFIILVRDPKLTKQIRKDVKL